MWLVCNKCGKKVNVKKTWEHEVCYECFEGTGFENVEEITELPIENVEETSVLAHKNVEETYIVKKNCWIGEAHYIKGDIVEYDSTLESLGVI